ncbi:transport inhibitor response 1-like protein [Lolium rigidum]|uniref:transport inhibitor response 1-like protein n=1 Tax=Lolium rigidum TaxID=89674 RepID=UPI001F5C5584|nr:transport inhibitor response 1-like protein [Lolium rigidum]
MSTPPSSSSAPIPTLASPGMRDAADDSDSPPSHMSEDSDGSGAGPGGDTWTPDLRGTNGGNGGNGGRWAPPDQVLENVLESVLEFLTAARDRNAASLVCRSWYAAEAQTRRELFIGNCYAVSPARAVQRFAGLRAVVLKGKPRFADFSLVPNGWGARVSPWVDALGPAYPRLQRICLKRMTVSDDELALIPRSFPLFRELSLVCCDGFTTRGLAVIAEGCRHLRVLDLTEDYFHEETEVVDWISKFPECNTSLESLVFDCVSVPFNFEALEALVARSPALRRLRVNDHVSIEQLRRLMARAPHLTHLGTGSFRSEPGSSGASSVSDLATSFAAAAKSLVCLSGFLDVNAEYLPAIYPVCANLTSLNFSFASLTSEELIPVINHCVNLRVFWVLDTVGDEGLRAVAETCSDLRELRVFPLDATEDSEGSVSDVGLQAISEGCRKLESILYFCQRMTNVAVIAMSENCPDLVVFRLCIMGRHRPDRVTGEPMDEGFGAIVKNCKKLTRLSVSGLLTDKAFAYIGKYGKLIKTLSVAFAGNSDMSLQHVFEGCTKLQKLEVRDSPFGDKGLLSGMNYFYNMRFFWMNSCRLTVKGCGDVAQQMPNLVVEVMKDHPDDEGEVDTVDKLYLYRSLAGPRTDAPEFVNIL